MSYQGVTASGEVHVLTFAGAKAALDDKALRAVNEQVERYVAAQTRLCREYNSCIIDADRYHAESHEASSRLTMAGQLVQRLDAAKEPGAVADASDALYAAFVPADQRVPSVNLKMTLEAVLPESLGAAPVKVPPNYPVPTGTKFDVRVELSRDAYVYLFQVDAQKKVNVLFPEERIAVSNPLRAGAPTRIPQGDLTFRVDEKGLGLENIFVVATSKPIQRLEESLRKFANGPTKSLAGDPVLGELDGMRPGKEGVACAQARDIKLDAPPATKGAGCVKSRGIVLDRASAPANGGAAAHSLEVRSTTGDDTIVKVFPFRHVPVEEYATALKQFTAATPEGARSRGIVVEE